MYPVRFPDQVPDFKKYGFDTLQSPHGIIVYMKPEKLWELETHDSCFPIPVTDWLKQSKYFHSAAALHHLGIIPTLTKEIFKSVDSISRYENDLHRLYGSDLPICQSLSEIFLSTLLALDLFGFTQTTDKNDKDKFNHIHKLMLESTENIYAFGQLDFALEKYNEMCYPGTLQNGIYMSGKTFRHLMKSMAVVKMLLEQIGFEVPLCRDIFDAISKFQNQQKIPQTGIIDPDSLKCLWDAAMNKSFDTSFLMHEIGFMKETSRNFENGARLIKPLNDGDKGRELLRLKLNDVISSIPDVHSGESFIEYAIDKELTDVAARTQALNKRVDGISKRALAMKTLIQRTAQNNARCDTLLEISSASLTDVLKAHIKAQEKFEEIKIQISFQRRTNHLLTFFGLCLLFLFGFKIMHIRR